MYTISPLPEQWGCSPSQCPIPIPDSVKDNPKFCAILNQARKPSTSCLYRNTWKSFLKFTESKGITPVPSSLLTLLTFIMYLFNLGMAHSTIKVYISAIVAHQPPGSSSAKLFSHPTLKRFLRGLKNIRPPHHRELYLSGRFNSFLRHSQSCHSNRWQPTMKSHSQDSIPHNDYLS